MDHRFFLTVFGGLALRGPDGSLDSRIGKRRLVLLATLAAAGERGVPRDTLVALFWTESDDARARGALKQAIYALRSEVGASAIPATSTGYALSSTEIGSDLRDFRQALAAGEPERAVALYASAFLAGVHLDGAAELDHWIERTRAELEADYRGALLGLLARNGAESVERRVDWAQRLLELDRADARAARVLVRALTESGRLGQARRIADEYERWVRDELGGTPDPSVAAALGSVGLDASAHEDHGASPGAEAAPVAVHSGRERVPSAGAPEPTEAAPGTAAPGTAAPGAAAPAARHRRPASALVLSALGVAALIAAVLVYGWNAYRDAPGGASSRVMDLRHVAKHPVYLRVTALGNDPTLTSAALVLREALTTAVPRAPAFLAVFRAPEDSVRLAQLPGLDTMAAPFDVTAQLSFVADSVMVFLQAENRANPAIAATATLPLGTRAAPLARLDDAVQRLLGALALRSDSDSLKTMVHQPPPRFDSYSRMKAAYELAHSDWDPARFLPLYLSAYELDRTWFLPVYYAVISYDALEEFEAGDSLLADASGRAAGLPELQRQIESYGRTRAASRGAGPASLPPAQVLLRRQPSATGAHLYYAARDYYLAGRPAEAAMLLARIDTAGGVLSTTDGSSYWLRSLSLHSSGQYASEMEQAEYRFAHPGSGLAHREYFDYMRAQLATGRSAQVLPRFDSLPGEVVEREQYVMHTFTLGGEAAFHGDPAVARALFERAADTCERRRQALSRHRRYCAFAYIALGDTVAARGWVDRLQRELDPLSALGLRGMLDARAGRTRETLVTLGRIASYEDDRRWGLPDLWRARILAVAGDREGAITALAEAKTNGWFPFFGTFGYFHWYPELALLKDDPRVRPYWVVGGASEPAPGPAL